MGKKKENAKLQYQLEHVTCQSSSHTRLLEVKHHWVRSDYGGFSSVVEKKCEEGEKIYFFWIVRIILGLLNLWFAIVEVLPDPTAPCIAFRLLRLRGLHSSRRRSRCVFRGVLCRRW